uniref:Tyrosine-protein phosphatase domain-containing protein n=1 Tax=Panagrolaimus davidi TaxID=227884 RepID=A0A914PYL3_9BILA
MTSIMSILKSCGKKIGDGIHEMYQSFERESPTFIQFFKKENESKNRYPTEIFLYDKNRVILSDTCAGSGDYYHGSFVDGFEQPKHYILAQSPFTSETEIDFYRLILQHKPDVIVFLMKFEGDDANYLTRRYVFDWMPLYRVVLAELGSITTIPSFSLRTPFTSRRANNFF